MMKELIDEWRNGAEDRQEDSFEFLTWLKGSPNPERDDQVAKAIHNEVFSEIDCTKCANCCKVYSAAVNESDIARIAKFIEMSEDDFAVSYLHKEDGELVIKAKPCPFLKDDKCSIYEIRPDSCRGFPFTDEDGFASRRYMHTGSTVACPAVFHIVERMKNELNWRPRRQNRRRW